MQLFLMSRTLINIIDTVGFLWSFQGPNVKRVYLGWFHKAGENENAVQVKSDDSTTSQRVVDFATDDELTVATILERAVKIYFPNGNSSKGKADDMNFKLCWYGGRVIVSAFHDIDGIECTFDSYIKSYGLYPSKKILYLLSIKTCNTNDMDECESNDEIHHSGTPETTRHEEPTSSKPKNELQWNNCGPASTTCSLTVLKDSVKQRQREIDLKYALTKYSRYTPEPSYCICSSRADCHNRACLENPDLGDTNLMDFHPVDAGFSLHRLAVQGHTYMEIAGNEVHFPEKSTDDHVIHGPDEVWGLENGHLVVSVISKGVLTGDSYNWYRNGQPLHNNLQANFIYINSPAIYSVRINNDQIQHSVNVVDVHSNNEKQQQCVVNSDSYFVLPQEVTLGKEIGKGSFSTVFQGDFQGTTIAVKKIKVRQMSVKLIEQEIAIHKQLSHPNVVLFMGASLGRGYILLLMEYMDGTNLETLIFDDETKQQYPELTQKVKVTIASQIAQAICYLHSRMPTIIHCDVKPANILLTRNYDIAKLCDLGISKVKRNEQTLTTARKDVLPGTPSYMAPELLLGRSRTTKTTDVWSLGCSYFELFTEKECWSSLDSQQGSGQTGEDDDDDDDDFSISLLKRYMKQKLQPYSHEEVSLVNKGIAKVIKGCLNYEPNDRPAASEIVIDLKACMQHFSLQ